MEEKTRGIFNGRLQIIVYACFELARLENYQSSLLRPFSYIASNHAPRKSVVYVCIEEYSTWELSFSVVRMHIFNLYNASS